MCCCRHGEPLKDKTRLRVVCVLERPVYAIHTLSHDVDRTHLFRPVIDHVLKKTAYVVCVTLRRNKSPCRVTKVWLTTLSILDM